MTISRKQIALIHVAKAKLRLEEASFRSALVEIAGVASTTELDKQGFETLMGFFEYLGFQPLVAKGENFGDRKGMASFAQLELIRTIWREYTETAYDGEEELNKWLTRSFKISSLRFLTKAKAGKVITALKSMKARAA